MFHPRRLARGDLAAEAVGDRVRPAPWKKRLARGRRRADAGRRPRARPRTPGVGGPSLGGREGAGGRGSSARAGRALARDDRACRGVAWLAGRAIGTGAREPRPGGRACRPGMVAGGASRRFRGGEDRLHTRSRRCGGDPGRGRGVCVERSRASGGEDPRERGRGASAVLSRRRAGGRSPGVFEVYRGRVVRRLRTRRRCVRGGGGSRDRRVGPGQRPARAASIRARDSGRARTLAESSAPRRA